MLIPKDPADSKNAVVEIRAGAGGDEASIFAGDLYRMYINFSSNKGWKTEIVDIAEGTSGGYKEIIFNVSGEDVYGILKFESKCIVFKEYPKLKLKEEYIRLQLQLLLCQKLKNLM